MPKIRRRIADGIIAIARAVAEISASVRKDISASAAWVGKLFAWLLSPLVRVCLPPLRLLAIPLAPAWRRLEPYLQPLRQVYNITAPFFTRGNGLRAAIYLVAIFLLTYASAKLNVDIKDAMQNQLDAIGGLPIAQPSSTIVRWILAVPVWLGLDPRAQWPLVFMALLFLVSPMQVVAFFLQCRMGLDWRSVLTGKGLKAMFAPMVAYLLERRGVAIDNTDQRLTDNIRDSTATLVALLVSLLQNLIAICVWTPELWHLSHALTFVVYGWTLLVSVVSALIGKRLIAQTKLLRRSEGDLRSTLQAARREATAIALTRCEDVVLKQAQKDYEAVYEAQLAVFKRIAWLQAFTTPTNGLVPEIAPVVLGVMGTLPLVVAILGALVVSHDVGLIMAATMCVTSLFGPLSIVPNQFPAISACLADAARVDSLQEAQKEYAEHPVAAGSISFADGDDVVFDKVVLKSEDGKTDLVRRGPDGADGLTLTVPKGSSLCIVGDDTVAQTAMVHLLGRLPASGSGRLTMPPVKDSVYLLETPFPMPMTLREAVTGRVEPDRCSDCQYDQEVRAALSKVGLNYFSIRYGLNTAQAWRKQLKLDELQRLNFARVVFSNPDFVVLDSALSALSEYEDVFYELLASRPGRTVIGTVTRPASARHYNLVLELPGDGRWLLHTRDDYDRILQEREAGNGSSSGDCVPR